MSKEKCSSENPETCRYHGHAAKVARVEEERRVAEQNKDFEGYYKATKTLEALARQQQVVAGLESSLEEASRTGDFTAYFNLTEGLAGGGTEPDGAAGAEPALAKLRQTLTQMKADDVKFTTKDHKDYEGSDGFIYVSVYAPEVQEGGYAPERVWSLNENGEMEAYVIAEEYSHTDYPYNLRIQASRPLTAEEKQKVAQLTGYQYKKTLGGEGLSDPISDGESAIVVSSDMTKAAGRKTRLSDFEDGLEETLQDGSDIRKTDRSGPGTAGTRLVEGLGDDVTFTLYYQEERVTFG